MLKKLNTEARNVAETIDLVKHPKTAVILITSDNEQGSTCFVGEHVTLVQAAYNAMLRDSALRGIITDALLEADSELEIGEKVKTDGAFIFSVARRHIKNMAANEVTDSPIIVLQKEGIILGGREKDLTAAFILALQNNPKFAEIAEKAITVYKSVKY